MCMTRNCIVHVKEINYVLCFYVHVSRQLQISSVSLNNSANPVPMVHVVHAQRAIVADFGVRMAG